MASGFNREDLEGLAGLIGRPNLLTATDVQNRTLIDTHWDEIVGGLLSAHTRPFSLKNNQLLVICDHPVFHQEMMLMAPTITARISRICGLSGIRMNFRIGRLIFRHPKIADGIQTTPIVTESRHPNAAIIEELKSRI